VDSLVGAARVELTLSLNYTTLMSVDVAMDDVHYNLNLPTSNTGRICHYYGSTFFRNLMWPQIFGNFRKYWLNPGNHHHSFLLKLASPFLYD